MRRIASLLAALATLTLLVAAPAAAAPFKLPKGADAPPVLPPGVVPAENPPVAIAASQARSADAAMQVAAKRFQVHKGSLPLWATVNICDTEKSPNALGIRTSVPGDGTRRRVYARYYAQWWSREKQAWLPVAGSGRTDWQYIGTLDWSAHQGGWTFYFSQPPAGMTYVLRGVVDLTWRDYIRASRRAGRKRGGRKRARWSTVRRKAMLTRTGMSGVKGGDPPGTSKAMCLIW